MQIKLTKKVRNDWWNEKRYAMTFARYNARKLAIYEIIIIEKKGNQKNL